MPLPFKRKTETGAPPKAKSKMGMVATDSGKGPAKDVMNRGIGGLSSEQMQGGDKPDEVKNSGVKGKAKVGAKKKVGKSGAKKTGTGRNY